MLEKFQYSDYTEARWQRTFKKSFKRGIMGIKIPDFVKNY